MLLTSHSTSQNLNFELICVPAYRIYSIDPSPRIKSISENKPAAQQWIEQINLLPVLNPPEAYLKFPVSLFTALSPDACAIER